MVIGGTPGQGPHFEDDGTKQKVGVTWTEVLPWCLGDACDLVRQQDTWVWTVYTRELPGLQESLTGVDLAPAHQNSTA